MDTHNGGITHLDPDILECEVKWALENITMNKANSWVTSNPKTWCCSSAALNMPANLENSAVATGLENVSFHSGPKEEQWQRMFKWDLRYLWKYMHCIWHLTHDLWHLNTLSNSSVYYISYQTEYIWLHIHCLSVFTPRLSII